MYFFQNLFKIYFEFIWEMFLDRFAQPFSQIWQEYQKEQYPTLIGGEAIFFKPYYDISDH